VKNEYLVLVDENDDVIGISEKMVTHREGLLHRAFSIIIYNDQKELLLQRRALSKYHSGGLWSNTCCGHPRPEEDIIMAARRRLIEEMGFECDLKELFTIHYYANLGNDMIENEFDHVFMGFKNDNGFNINKDEISEWRWSSLDEISNDINKNPKAYTSWFIKIVDRLICDR